MTDEEKAFVISTCLEKMQIFEKEHMVDIMYQLVHCYGKDAGKAVILFQPYNTEYVSITTANCNDMEAATLLLRADEHIGYVNRRNAPPKEMFN